MRDEGGTRTEDNLGLGSIVPPLSREAFRGVDVFERDGEVDQEQVKVCSTREIRQVRTPQRKVL